LPLWRRVISARRFIDEPLESSSQHFAHHAEIVTRRDVRGFDVELAVLILAQALWSGDDHGTDRVRALDVAVIVDLDAARRRCQPEASGERGKEPLLGGRLGQLAAERLAGIGKRVFDDIAFGAPTRYADVDLVVALCGQRLCKQFALLDVAGQEDEARTR